MKYLLCSFDSSQICKEKKKIKGSESISLSKQFFKISKNICVFLFVFVFFFVLTKNKQISLGNSVQEE